MGMSGDTALTLAKSYVKKTLQGQGALKGQDGFSPIIEENADNTDKVYKLDITTADSAFTTPNLRGKDGEGSGGGEANVIESISVNGTPISVDENKNVDITVPSIEELSSNLVRVDKNTIANLCNGKNVNNIIIGRIKANTIYTLFFEQDSETGFNLRLNNSDGVNVSYKEISPTYSKTKVICWFSNTYDVNIFFNGWKTANQRNFMIVEGKFDEWIDYITPTGNSGRLNVDVANLKNDLGSTDISTIGDGTVTGAISAVNSKLGGLIFSASGTTLSITDGVNTWTLPQTT